MSNDDLQKTRNSRDKGKRLKDAEECSKAGSDLKGQINSKSNQIEFREGWGLSPYQRDDATVRCVLLLE